MNKLQQISSQPDYNAKANSFSKLIMAVFFISYVYMVFTVSGDVGGWIWATLFLIGGLFLTSILIAMPLFILKRLFPSISILITVLSVIITFFATKFFFVLLLV